MPEFNAVVEKWTDNYLLQELSKPSVSRRVERSNTNHFMYWNAGEYHQVAQFNYMYFFLITLGIWVSPHYRCIASRI